MSPCFNKTDLHDTQGQSYGHILLVQVEMWLDILGIYTDLFSHIIYTDLNC